MMPVHNPFVSAKLCTPARHPSHQSTGCPAETTKGSKTEAKAEEPLEEGEEGKIDEEGCGDELRA